MKNLANYQVLDCCFAHSKDEELPSYSSSIINIIIILILYYSILFNVIEGIDERIKVLEELWETENVYVRDLGVVVNVSRPSILFYSFSSSSSSSSY